MNQSSIDHSNVQSDMDYDFIIIGSGFGGSVSAHRLTEKGYSVAVMEMGRRWAPEDFPKTNWNVRKWMWRPAAKMFGFYNMRRFRHMVVASGNAVGGGSITYANALYRAPDSVWKEGSWSALNDWQSVMPGHYAEAEAMLGVTEPSVLGEADHRLQRMADLQGVGDTFHLPRVATFFAPDGEPAGKTHPDPYFGGEGPQRGSCVACGGCMMGCRHNAKNTLDKNYLYLAEKRGAQVFSETRVVDVRPLGNQQDGSEGYEVITRQSTATINRELRRFRCRSVIFAASSLGTMELLFRLKQKGSLPFISDHLGKGVRTNAESLLGVRFPSNTQSMSEGLAGGGGIYLDDKTHIGVVRYPEGSDAIGLMMTLLVGGKAGWSRIFSWLGTLVRHPLKALRVHNPVGFARQTMLLLVMQTSDSHIDMRMQRRWYWPFSWRLQSHGAPIPTFIPEANDFAEKGAKALGGTPTTFLSEILFNVPTTAHCMGGCAMADRPEDGVIDAQNRVFGYQNMRICDGSTLSANLGVNPSLTIAALTEHAMSHIPPKTDRHHTGATVMKQTNTQSRNLLADPLTLSNGQTLRNRLAKAAMSEALGTYDNRPTEELVRLYQRWGESGAGLMMTGNVMIDRGAIGEPGNVVIEDESDLPVLRRWAEAATRHGAAIWAQLNHPGKQATKGLNEYTVAPSAVPFRKDMQSLFETPREATHDQIDDIIRRFGRAAAICQKAGFSGVQIHGAHGYLINQFLSPHHNTRNDEWGGTPEKRRRFVLAVYEEIRHQVGPKFPVAIKLNSADFQRGGFTEEESMETMRALEDAGIDLIEISGGTYEDPAMSGRLHEPKKQSTVQREAYFLEFADKVRATIKVPLMVTGGFRSYYGMNAALGSGALDVVGLARLMAIDPEAPRALLDGRNSDEVVQPIKTGIKQVDKMGIMEIFYYTGQLKRVARGRNPQPRQNALVAFIKAVLSSGWGTFRTRRARG